MSVSSKAGNISREAVIISIVVVPLISGLILFAYFAPMFAPNFVVRHSPFIGQVITAACRQFEKSTLGSDERSCIISDIEKRISKMNSSDGERVGGLLPSLPPEEKTIAIYILAKLCVSSNSKFTKFIEPELASDNQKVREAAGEALKFLKGHP